MPLSEEELRLLEQMERALVEEDPKFASTLRGSTLRRTARRRAIAAGACFFLGIVVLMTGAVTEVWGIGIAGFVVMLASAMIGLTAVRGRRAVPAPNDAHPPAGDGSHGFTLIHGGGAGRSRRPRRPSQSFLDRMEERWRRRRESGGF